MYTVRLVSDSYSCPALPGNYRNRIWCLRHLSGLISPCPVKFQISIGGLTREAPPCTTIAKMFLGRYRRQYGYGERERETNGDRTKLIEIVYWIRRKRGLEKWTFCCLETTQG